MRPWIIQQQERNKKLVKKLRSTKLPESYCELCQWCKKDKKNVRERRDPVTRGLTCTSCEKEYRGKEFLTYVVETLFGIELAASTNDEIGEFMNGLGEDSIFTEHDLYRIGLKEQVVIGSRAVDVRYYYCPLTQVQFRLIFDEDASVAVRKMKRTNFWKQSASGIALSRKNFMHGNKSAITRSDCYRKAYISAVKDQNNLEKKPTKKQLKGDFWHEKNMAAIAAFEDLGKLAHYRQHYSKHAYRKRKLEPFKNKVDGWKAFKKRKLVDAKAELKKQIDDGNDQESIQTFERKMKAFKKYRRHPGLSPWMYKSKFFTDALKEEEGLKNHGYAKKGKLDLTKWKDWNYRQEWLDADVEGYKQMWRSKKEKKAAVKDEDKQR